MKSWSRPTTGVMRLVALYARRCNVDIAHANLFATVVYFMLATVVVFVPNYWAFWSCFADILPPCIRFVPALVCCYVRQSFRFLWLPASQRGAGSLESISWLIVEIEITGCLAPAMVRTSQGGVRGL